MPTLAVVRDTLFKLMGKSYTDEQFEDLCFEFGIELDDITSEKEIFLREHGRDVKGTEKLSEEVVYKIDTPANRYDLLCAEGMSMALKVFLGAMPAPTFKVLNRNNAKYNMTVRRSVKNVRDYVVCAVLRNISLSETGYNSFIDFQDKLHSGLARRRTLASVGTHDLDKINCNDFIYSARPKDTIQFVPLNQSRVLSCAGDGLAEYYKDDRHILKFVPLISSMPNYPLITDKNGQILSLPPIINSDFSKIERSTKNIFIECTATDHYKAHVLVNQIVCAFSSLCEEPFTVEAVKVQYEDASLPTGASTEVTPNLDSREMSVNVDNVNRRVGINLQSAQECAGLLKKMCLHTEVVNNNSVKVFIPACRSDIIHPCDLIEDVAISYGYDNIKYQEVQTHGSVTQSPDNKLAHLLRLEVANAGYIELLTFSLCSRDEAFAHLNRKDSDVAVHIMNPQTFEFQVCRPSLMPGMLKTLSSSKSHPLPLKFFEVSDVVMLDNEINFPPALESKLSPIYSKPGARNQKHCCALVCTTESSGFEEIHGLVEYVMLKLGVTPFTEEAGSKDTYSVAEGSDGAFFPGRAMNVFLHRDDQKTQIGHFGVVHPKTLKAFEIPFPCSYCEINVQPFIFTETP